MNFRGPALTTAAFLLLVAGSVSAEVKTRAFRHAFPAAANANTELRLANLAGKVQLVPGSGNQVVVEATVHADAGKAAETQRLLQEMKWVRSTDRNGNAEWALSYPVDRYKGFTYPRPGKEGDDDLPGFLSVLGIFGGNQSQTTYRGERVAIYGQERSSAPTLYANLRIALPAGSNVVVRNVVGAINGQGNLEGTLTVDTGSGNVQLASYSGNLTIDTGSGNVVVGAARGETLIDTGSGDVVVRKLVGNGMVDTGSGNVTIDSVSAGRLGVDTGSGDVIVRNGTAAKLIADTGSGNVHVLQVEIQELEADTGSGDVIVNSSLAQAKRVLADTGSGSVRILAGATASFDIESDQGSGELKVGYADATLRKSGRKVVGARRGNGQTTIRVETGSGDCVISPRG
jgi:hypothetical protein